MSDEIRKPLFHYNDITNEIEYGNISVQIGSDRVDVEGSTGQILHNGTPIGGEGGSSPSSPYMLPLLFVRCGINVPGDPDELGQTVTRPLKPFVILAGEGAPTGAGSPKLMTVNMTTPLNYSFIFPNLSFSSETGVFNTFDCFSGYNTNRNAGFSIGRRTNYDPVTGLHTYTFTIDFAAVWEMNDSPSLVVLVTMDSCTADGNPPVAGPP